jgi:hypothetical protein
MLEGEGEGEKRGKGRDKGERERGRKDGGWGGRMRGNGSLVVEDSLVDSDLHSPISVFHELTTATRLSIFPNELTDQVASLFCIYDAVEGRSK